MKCGDNNLITQSSAYLAKVSVIKAMVIKARMGSESQQSWLPSIYDYGTERACMTQNERVWINEGQKGSFVKSIFLL